MPKLTLLLALPAIVFAADTNADAVFTAIRNNNLAALRALKDANLKDDRGITALMVAAYAGSADAMKLLIDKGADVNAKNAFGSTALMWSVTDLQKAKMLVDHGADVNAKSKLGRTPVILAAMSDRSAEMVRFLVSKGADLKAVDGMNTTVLHAATTGNDTGTIRIALDAGLDVNAADFLGMTPLMYAAVNSNTGAVKMLLARGANVNAVSLGKNAKNVVKNGPIDLGNFTALLVAAPYGPAELVKALLDAGADVNAKDVRGMTPLMLAVATDHGDVEIVKMLLAKGADTKIQSAAGETAYQWAGKFGETAARPLLNHGMIVDGLPPIPIKLPDVVDARAAAEKGLALLEKTGTQFFANGGCSSCHAQNIVDFAANVARAKGMKVDEKQTAERQKMNRAFFGSMVPNLLERLDPPGNFDLIIYAMAGLAASGYAPDRMTDGIVADLAAQQLAEGHWNEQVAIARPPIEDSGFFRAALGIRVLKTYGPPGRRAEMEERIARAKSWLASAKPRTMEDRDYQLLGLLWAGENRAELRKLADAILGMQRADGGWSQTTALGSDAYATGQTLYALAESGVSTRDARYQKGVKFLAATQKDDGSWYVRSRAPKFQPYFQSGFPYGHDQWISSMATGWAVAALAEAVAPVAKKSAE